MLNIIIIILSVIYLVYLSTFDYADLPIVVSEHGEWASSIVAIFIVMFGFTVLMAVLSMVINGKIRSRQRAFLYVLMALSVNASCLATVKPAMAFIKSGYDTVGDFVTAMKMTSHNKIQ